MSLKDKIKNKQEKMEETTSTINELSSQLKSKKEERDQLLEELKELETKLICETYKVELNKTILNIENKEYLLRDISYLGTPIVSTKNKNGKWGTKSFDLGLFNWEKKEKVSFEGIKL